LDAEKLVPFAALTAWAVDTLIGGLLRRSKIVLLQQDKA
jgi:hypothetical protein